MVRSSYGTTVEVVTEGRGTEDEWVEGNGVNTSGIGIREEMGEVGGVEGEEGGGIGGDGRAVEEDGCGR